MEYAEIQGFKKPGNDFVVKELAILPLEGEQEPVVLPFKAPFPWRRLTNKYKRENPWLELCYHNFDWHSGDYDYMELENILRDGIPNVSKIYMTDDLRKQ